METTRSPQPRPEGWTHRGARPAMMWAAVLLGGVCVLFVLGVLSAILLGFWRTVAQGHSAPDFTGGLANLAPLIMAVAAVATQGAQIFQQRHAERRDQIARGAAPGPIEPSPPSPDGGGRPGDSV